MGRISGWTGAGPVARWQSGNQFTLGATAAAWEGSAEEEGAQGAEGTLA